VFLEVSFSLDILPTTFLPNSVHLNSRYMTRSPHPVRYELDSYIQEDDIVHTHRRENLKSYIALTC
jgi:hypothetical protein